MLNTTQEIADAIVEWTRGKIPALETGYAFPADEKTGDLPDVAAEIQRIKIQRTSTENFPAAGVQQVLIRVFQFNLMFLVNPDPAEEATKQLEEFVDTITTALLEDPSMGELLPNVSLSPVFDSSFTPPFVEFEDGTKGRMATMELVVGELIDSYGAQL
jgi:hypothetical protein